MMAARLCSFAFALSVLAATTMAVAQDSTTQPKKIGMLPFAMTKGTDGAKKATRDYLDNVLLKAGFEVIPQARTIAAWKAMGQNVELDDRAKELPEIPTAKTLLELGEKLDVDFIVFPRATWHTRSIWVGLGPKTKSDCTVDMIIIDVRKREVALEAKEVRMDSTAKEDALKAAGTVFLTPLFTAISGGPKTPHETRAGVLAVAKAIQPWLPVTSSAKKIK